MHNIIATIEIILRKSFHRVDKKYYWCVGFFNDVGKKENYRYSILFISQKYTQTKLLLRAQTRVN